MPAILFSLNVNKFGKIFIDIVIYKLCHLRIFFPSFLKPLNSSSFPPCIPWTFRIFEREILHTLSKKNIWKRDFASDQFHNNSEKTEQQLLPKYQMATLGFQPKAPLNCIVDNDTIPFIEDDQTNNHLHIREDDDSSKSDAIIVPMVNWSGASRAGQVHLIVHFLSLRKLDI